MIRRPPNFNAISERLSEPVPCDPQITFRVVNDTQVQIDTSWAPGTNLSAFAHLLVMLQTKELVAGIIEKMGEYARKIGEGDKIIEVQKDIVQRLMDESEDPDDDNPVVLPSKAISYNAKLNYGHS